MKKSEIKLVGLQIKSLKKMKLLAKKLNDIEIECGIKEVKITFDDCFVCSDINLEKLNTTSMEKLIRDVFNQINI